MKTKKTTYLLIAGFCLIWGFVIYNLFNSFKKDSELKKQEVQNTLMPKDASRNDEFSLLLNYNDPFLQSYVKPKKTIVNSGLSLKPKLVKKVSPVMLKPVDPKPVSLSASAIRYYGLIKNQDRDQKVGVVYIQNQEYLISEGSEIEDFRIVSMKEMSIDVSYKEKTFTIELQK